MKTKDFLKKHDACKVGAKWALSISDNMADVWEAMVAQGKRDWLMWTAVQPGVFSASDLRKLSCRLVRETPSHYGSKVWDLLTDERSRRVVEVSEAYADGKATSEEMMAARDDAYIAYDEAHAASVAHDTGYVYRVAASVAHDTGYVCRAVAHAAAFAASVADAAHASRATAYAAAYTESVAKLAQVKVIAELGNPFVKEK